MVLELEHVQKYYKIPGNNQPVKVLEDINLSVEKGDTLAIVGPSGSGKSTLLNIIGALDYPTNGRAILSGKDLAALKESDLAKIRNEEIGFVFQLHHLLPQCTVLENILIPTIPLRHINRNNEAAERAEDLLKRVGLAARRNHYPGQLSGGERQRTALVRALINQPQFLLADEPTGSLDHASALSLSRLLIELNREEKTTLIVVTHSIELAQKMNQQYLLQDGILKPN